MALTKIDLARKICESLRCSKQESREIVEYMISILKKALCSGDAVLISGFGKFYVKSKKERMGTNPATGLCMVLPGRRVVKFKGAAKLKEKVNRRKSARR